LRIGLTLAVVLLGTAIGSAESGTLILAGGGKNPEVVLARFMKAAGGAKGRVVVIPTASESAADPKANEIYLSQWLSYQPESLKLMHAKTREAASQEEFLKPFREATGVWLSGGDQTRLTKMYLGTPVEKELQALLSRGGVIGGTSAGTAVQSEIMIEGGQTKPETSAGFGWLKGFVADQHFFKRSRLNRLMLVLQDNPKFVGLGIDEGTAAVVSGETIEIIGESYVMLALKATATEPPFFRILKSGEKASVKEWREKAVSRAAGKP
jgi:cyanophycinase